MKPGLFYILSLLFFNIPLLKAQDYNPGLMRQSITYAISLLEKEKLIWNGHTGIYVLRKDSVTLQFYDLYSCSCAGIHEVLDTTSIKHTMDFLSLNEFKPVRLDEKTNEYYNTITFVFCNKKQQDDYGEYLGCRVIYISDFIRTINLKMYIDDERIINYRIESINRR